MKSTKVLLVGAVILLAVTVFLSPGRAQVATRPEAATAKIAVCDIGDVFGRYQRMVDLNNDMNTRAKATAEEDKKKADKIQELEKKLEGIAPGSKEMQTRLDEMQQLSIERKVWQQVQEERFVRERRVLTEALYKEILSAVEALAKERGFDIVLYRENVEIASATTTELLGKMIQRKCLYADNAFDLTAPVLERLNRNYTGRIKP